MFTDLISALSEFDADKSAAEVKRLLDEGVDPFEIIENGLMQAMDIVGTRFEAGTYFLPELLLAAKAVEACSALIRPVLTADQQQARSTIVVGTVAGDIHDLGKNLIISTLESAGFRVIDLGVDVPLETFVICFYDDIAMQTGPMVSLDHYRQWILPYEKRLTDIAARMTKAKRSIHCCGSCYDLLPGFIEAGYEILNPVQTRARNMEAWRLKENYGDQVSFYGGLDVQRLLPFGTVDEVRQGVKELIKTLGPGGGFLFATSHNIEPDTPLENIVALFDTVHEFGRYPLSLD